MERQNFAVDFPNIHAHHPRRTFLFFKKKITTHCIQQQQQNKTNSFVISRNLESNNND